MERESGIHLSDAKRALLTGRLSRRLRELELDSFAAYYRRIVEEPGGAELTRMLDAIATNETHFFREPRHFEFLAGHVLPRFVQEAERGERAKEVRIWSAACSTGEEPYSLAMCLLEGCPPSAGWSVEVVATDLSTRVLEQARAGVFRIEKARELPPHHLKRFMLRGTGSQLGKMKVDEELRSIVRFQRANLIDSRPPVEGTFDLVFLRNVLIYFQAETRARVVERALAHLRPGGFLFLGHAETLAGHADRARCVLPTIYTHATPAPNRGTARRAAAAGPGRS